MTTHANEELTAAQERLEQARTNDRALRDRHKPHASVVAVLQNIKPEDEREPAPVRALYPTPAQAAALGKIRSVPRYVAAIHDDYCQGGKIFVAALGSDQPTSVPCPHCERTRAERKLREQLISSGVDGRYLETEWDDLQLPKPLDRVAARCRDIDALIDAGANLLLYSEQTGTGKTQAAMLAAKAAARAGRTTAVINLARLALDVRESYRDKSGDAVTELAALLQLTRPDLLILDDLGAGESDTAAVERRLLFLALNERQIYRKPVIVTTNLLLQADGDKPTLGSVFGARILARLQPLTALNINHGTNFRAQKAAVSW